MRDTLVIALEAAWELDPIRIESKLWNEIDSMSELCYTSGELKRSVEQVSNDNSKMAYLCAFLGLRA